MGNRGLFLRSFKLREKAICPGTHRKGPKPQRETVGYSKQNVNFRVRWSWIQIPSSLSLILGKCFNLSESQLLHLQNDHKTFILLAVCVCVCILNQITFTDIIMGQSSALECSRQVTKLGEKDLE